EEIVVAIFVEAAKLLGGMRQPVVLTVSPLRVSPARGPGAIDRRDAAAITAGVLGQPLPTKRQGLPPTLQAPCRRRRYGCCLQAVVQGWWLPSLSRPSSSTAGGPLTPVP